MKIEVESEALDSLKAMAQRLQEERDELLEALMAIRHGGKSYNFSERISDLEMADIADKAIAKCTAKPEVLE